MFIIVRETGEKAQVQIERVTINELKSFRKNKFWFDWKTEVSNEVYKLITADSNVQGLISLIPVEGEQRIQINLLCVAKENRGSQGKYRNVAGVLIAYTCRLALKNYGIRGCVSLVPKTTLKEHYIKRYGMLDAGKQVFLEGASLIRIINRYAL
jgi:hypothetical protein